MAITRTPIKLNQLTLGSSSNEEVTGASFVSSSGDTVFTVDDSSHKPFLNNSVIVYEGAAVYGQIQDQIVDSYDSLWTSGDGGTTWTVHDDQKPLKSELDTTAWKKTVVSDKATTTFNCSNPGTWTIYQIGGASPVPKPWTDDTIVVFNGEATVNPSDYSINYEDGIITFNSAKLETDVIAATFTWWQSVAIQTIDLDAGVVVLSAPNATTYFNYVWEKTMYSVDNDNGVVTFIEAMSSPTFDYTWVRDIPTTIYTVSASQRVQVVQVFVVNVTASSAELRLFAHGNQPSNTVLQDLVIPAGGSTIIEDIKIILSAGDVLAAQGAGLVVTAYGVLEAGL